MSDSSHVTTHRSPERRRSPRLDAQGKLAIYVLTERRLEARLHDFSAGGFMVRSQRPLAPGDVHQVLIASRNTPADSLSAQVAYCQQLDTDDGRPWFQIGFEFVELDGVARRLIESHLDELSAQIESLTA